MSDDGILNREFLATLETRHRDARENRVGDLLRVAGQDTFDAETRRRYVDAAMAFDPHAMAAVLHDIIGRETSASADRISAATLYLHGGSKGWWKVPAPAAERARTLLATEKPTTKPAPKKDQPMRSGSRARKLLAMAEDGNDLGFYLAISQACSRMEAIVKDPATTDAGKIQAIARWMRVMSRIAPDEFDAALAKAAEKLSPPNPQSRST